MPAMLISGTPVENLLMATIQHRPIPFREMADFLIICETSKSGLRWIKPISRKIKAGVEAGTLHHGGYYQVRFQGRYYFCSRIIYAIHNQEDPGQLQIDHINRIRSDNRVENLRLVTNRQNHQNRTNHGLYPVGVDFHEDSKSFRARIVVVGKQQHLGLFSTPEEASAVYQSKCLELAC